MSGSELLEYLALGAAGVAIYLVAENNAPAIKRAASNISNIPLQTAKTISQIIPVSTEALPESRMYCPNLLQIALMESRSVMNKEKEKEEIEVIRMICNLTKDFRTYGLLDDELLKTIDVKDDLLRGVTGFDKGRIPLQGSSR